MHMYMYMYITSEGQERKKYIHRMECGQEAEGGGGKQSHIYK